MEEAHGEIDLSNCERRETCDECVDRDHQTHVTDNAEGKRDAEPCPRDIGRGIEWAIAVARNAAAAAGLHKYSRTRRLSATATQSSAETASPTASSTVDVLLILNSPHVDR